jgi:Kef-type K+ transport system membrane component KefB
MLSALATLLALILLLFYIARWINKSQIFESILQRVLIYVILGGSSAIVTHMVDLSSALGAFIAGMMITIAGHEQKTHIYTRCRFEKLFRWMVPVFFLSIGVQVTQLPVSGGHLMLLTSVLLAAAIIGKLFSPWCVKNHFSQRERWTLGFALLPRGEVGLIVASMGLQLGHVSEHMMIALVTMTLATALIAPIGIAIASRPLQSK